MSVPRGLCCDNEGRALPLGPSWGKSLERTAIRIGPVGEPGDRMLA